MARALPAPGFCCIVGGEIPKEENMTTDPNYVYKAMLEELEVVETSDFLDGFSWGVVLSLIAIIVNGTNPELAFWRITKPIVTFFSYIIGFFSLFFVWQSISSFIKKKVSSEKKVDKKLLARKRLEDRLDRCVKLEKYIEKIQEELGNIINGMEKEKLLQSKDYMEVYNQIHNIRFDYQQKKTMDDLTFDEDMFIASMLDEG
jgi:hypothetical protein